MLESRWEDPQIAADENRPGRRFYVLTGQGMAAARATPKDPGFFRFARPRRKRVAPA